MKLQNIVEIKTGLPLSRKKGEKFEYKLLTLKCFQNDSIYLNPNCLDTFIANEKLDDYIANSGDIVVRLRVPIKAIYITKDVLVPSTMVILKAKKKIDMKFLTYYLNSKISKKALSKNIEGSLIKMVGSKDLKNIKISLPPLNIQQKIAKTLLLIDKEIELLDKLQKEKKILKDIILERLSNDKK